jgi:hypothetical protein
MPATDPHGRRLALAIVVLGVGWTAGVLYWTRNASLPPDAEAYGVIARNLARGDGYTESFVPFHPGPYESVRHLPDLHGLLTPALLAPLFVLFGASGSTVRIPSTLATAGIAFVVFALARRLFGSPAAFLAALLVLASPTLLWYSSSATDDTGFTLLALATLALLALAVHERRPPLAAWAGLVTGMAILEKPTGIFLPALGVIAWLWLRRTTRVPAATVAALFVPSVLAFGAYLARNQAAHGSLDFRFGGLEWIWKDAAFEGMMALYDRAPRSLETIQRLGLARVLEITRHQLGWWVRTTFALHPVVRAGFADVFRVVAVPAFLPLLALVPLPWLARRVPSVAALVAAMFVAAPAVVCTLWHPEPRYFAVYIPLAALVLAGTLGRTRAGLAAMAALVLVSCAGFVGAAQALGRLRPDACMLGLRRLAEAGTAGPILTLDPWSVAWLADREAVMIPSGGLDAIARVARRYETRLILIHPMMGRPQTSALLANLEGASGPLRVTTIHRQGACRIATLDVLGDTAP